MKIDVTELKQEAGRHFTVPVQITVETFEMAGDKVEFDRPFTGSAEVWNAGDRLLIRASLSGEATVACSRCLSPFTVPIETSFEEEFIEGDGPTDEETEDERTVTYYQGYEIDLSEPLREHVLLELPMKPLCKKECEGLCPKCGANLNEGPCNCQEIRSVDPRFAVLKDLVHKPDSNS